MELGTFSLTQVDGGSDLAVTGPGTTDCDVIDGLDGMSGVTLLARFSYGSGSGTAQVYVKTSLDFGASWMDLACFAFASLSDALVVNLSSETAVDVPIRPGDAILADNTAISGPLGDRLRCTVVVTGLYGGSTLLAVRATVR